MTIGTDERLLPCPFCGSEIRQTPLLGSETEKRWVHYGNGCVLELCRIPKDKIAAWNTRARTASSTREAE